MDDDKPVAFELQLPETCFECDGCHHLSPWALSLEAAREEAEFLGWFTNTDGFSLCPKCRPGFN